MSSLDESFRLIVIGSYWVIVALWLAILGIFLGRLRRTHRLDEAFRVLIIVLAIDAFRTETTDGHSVKRSGSSRRKRAVRRWSGRWPCGQLGAGCGQCL